jgi:tetratricopeptide (TPR) repeat protein
VRTSSKMSASHEALFLWHNTHRREPNHGKVRPDTDMKGSNLDSTQPSQPKEGRAKTAPISSPPPQKPGAKKSKKWFWVILFLLGLSVMVVIGVLLGYESGRQTNIAVKTRMVELTLEEQFDLGVQDLEAGRYEVAYQRFEYIIEQDPSFPGVTEKLADAMSILYATATPTQASPTISPTPTIDLRPVEELFNQAIALVSVQDWGTAIDTLLALRNADQAYEVARVDGLLFVSLRHRGLNKIWQEGNLVGGLYDLALAERFGPLDVQSTSARDLARLYIIGSSFWEVHPEQAVYYFSQVAAAAPGLRDASGWTASERYREALIQYGDFLASQNDWCNAQAQYELAFAISGDAALQEKHTYAALQCSPPSETPLQTTETLTPTWTPTGATVPPGLTATPTATQGGPPIVTPTPTVTQTSTPTQPAAVTPTPTATQTAVPTDTVPPSPTPSATSGS